MTAMIAARSSPWTTATGEVAHPNSPVGEAVRAGSESLPALGAQATTLPLFHTRKPRESAPSVDRRGWLAAPRR